MQEEEPERERSHHNHTQETEKTGSEMSYKWSKPTTNDTLLPAILHTLKFHNPPPPQIMAPTGDQVCKCRTTMPMQVLRLGSNSVSSSLYRACRKYRQ